MIASSSSTTCFWMVSAGWRSPPTFSGWLVLWHPADTIGAMNKETKRLIRLATDQGWRVVVNKHVKLFSPNGKDMVVMPATPGEYRGIKNAKAALRRAGLKMDVSAGRSSSLL